MPRSATRSPRQGDWRLIPQCGSGGYTPPRDIEPAAGEPAGQMYNLADVPSETRNLWNEYPDVVARLTALLTEVQGG